MLPRMTEHVTRRTALLALGGLGVLVACGGKRSTTNATPAATTSTSATSSGTATASPQRVSCILTPEATEGPFYVAGAPTRRNVTEGQAGTPLALSIVVLDATTCQPIKSADVEIWHANASGEYSGVQNQTGSDWLRGHQIADANGLVTFATIYPGWYQGRTTHVHVMVHVGGSTVHTGQLFFEDATNAAVFAQGAYASRGQASDTNAGDSIYGQAGGATAIVPVTKSGSGYAGRINIGVRTT
ncbi:MAG: hypothetical protein QOG53_263 [Frankiales bacterium]|jgi:protocatechuate 3,4-dioxygenase beta subunit|nr:hypothetical protein [Frankiales bacterium]